MDFFVQYWRNVIINIRSACVEDAHEIAKVYIDTWRSTYPGILPDKVLLEMSIERQIAIWVRAIKHSRGPTDEKILVLEKDDKNIIGISSCGFNRDRKTNFDGEVYTLYVHPNHQGHGYGKDLLFYLFDILLTQNYRSVIIWTLRDNPSRFFYEAMSGKRIGERQGKTWGLILNEIAYGWSDLSTFIKSYKAGSTN